MKDMQIKLLTKQHDEIGRLPLSNVEIEDGASEALLGGPAAVIGQVEELYGRIEAALKHEGFTLVGSAIDFRLSVSRALLSDAREPTVVVSLTVEPLNTKPVSESPTTDHPSGSPGLLDDLFDLPVNSNEGMEELK